MKSVYTERIDGLPCLPLLYPNFGLEERDSILYMQNAFRHMDMRSPFVRIVKKPEEADYILVAHNYSSLSKHGEYVERLAALAKKHGKQLLIFAHGDSDAPIPYPEAKIFRTSQYRPQLAPNEIILPAYAEDLLENTEVIVRHKGAIPVVGFCGWAQYKNLKNRIGTMLRNAYFTAVSWLRGDTHVLAHKKGITFRMKALRTLSRASGIRTNFIIRKSYSGHKKTISMNPEQARLEYRGNLLGSDFALIVKGDGNYSYRFYEALSVGRIPLILDTDCLFPLEDQIDYSTFTVRVPFTDLSRLADYVLKKYHSMSDEQFVAMQQKAREVFEQYLRVDAYLRYAAEHLL